MIGGKNKKPLGRGYTIIEVMLFLAISGFMFVLAAIFINGKQASAEFRQGMNDTNTRIRAVMNDVVNGFYPSNNDFKCSAGTSGAPVISSGSSDQGANLGCMFVGKVIQFGIKDTGNATDGWPKYRVYSVAARQFASGNAGQTPANFGEAQPIAITEPSTIAGGSYAWGLTVTGICTPPPAPGTKCTSTAPGAVGFFGAFGAFDSSNTLQSGSQSVNVALIPNSDMKNDLDEVANIKSLAGSGSILPNPNILLCFTGGKGQKASITIGGSHGQQLTSTIKMGDSRC